MLSAIYSAGEGAAKHVQLACIAACCTIGTAPKRVSHFSYQTSVAFWVEPPIGPRRATQSQ